MDVSAYAGPIAAGGQRFAFEGRVRSQDETQPDSARLVVEYRNLDNTQVLDSFDSGELVSTLEWLAAERTSASLRAERAGSASGSSRPDTGARRTTPISTGCPCARCAHRRCRWRTRGSTRGTAAAEAHPHDGRACPTSVSALQPGRLGSPLAPQPAFPGHAGLRLPAAGDGQLRHDGRERPRR